MLGEQVLHVRADRAVLAAWGADPSGYNVPNPRGWDAREDNMLPDPPGTRRAGRFARTARAASRRRSGLPGARAQGRDGGGCRPRTIGWGSGRVRRRVGPEISENRKRPHRTRPRALSARSDSPGLPPAPTGRARARQGCRPHCRAAAKPFARTPTFEPERRPQAGSDRMARSPPRATPSKSPIPRPSLGRTPESQR